MICWVYLRSVVERFVGLTKVDRVEIRLTQIVMRRDVIRFDRHRLLQHVDGLGWLARLVVNVTESIECLRILWIERNSFLVSRDRFRLLAKFVCGASQIV